MRKINPSVSELQGNEYVLINHDLDVMELNKDYDQDCGCYIAKIENGEYIELYGLSGTIPYLNSIAWTIK